MVANNLELQLSDTEKHEIEVIPTQNKAAYEAYLKGVEYSHNFTVNENKLDNDLAEKFYQKSIGLDSSFADPYFNLAFVYWNKATITDEGYNWLDSAKALNDQGLKLGPGSADAYQVTYLICWTQQIKNLYPTIMPELKKHW